MLSSKDIEISKSEVGNFGVEIQAAVRAELEMMLKAPYFAQSHRCKDFLSYVVLQALSGNANRLKERTIGISVFGRATDYDTGDDSIVRVTANDVRKRIDQFYRESRVAHTMQIELPKGAYVPEFRIQPLQRGKEIELDGTPDFSHQATAESEAGRASETPSLVVGSEVTAKDQSPLVLIEADEKPRFRRAAVCVPSCFASGCGRNHFCDLERQNTADRPSNMGSISAFKYTRPDLRRYTRSPSSQPSIIAGRAKVCRSRTS